LRTDGGAILAIASLLSGLVMAIGTLQPLSFYVVSLSGYGEVSIEISFFT